MFSSRFNFTHPLVIACMPMVNHWINGSMTKINWHFSLNTKNNPFTDLDQNRHTHTLSDRSAMASTYADGILRTLASFEPLDSSFCSAFRKYDRSSPDPLTLFQSKSNAVSVAHEVPIDSREVFCLIRASRDDISLVVRWCSTSLLIQVSIIFW